MTDKPVSDEDKIWAMFAGLQEKILESRNLDFLYVMDSDLASAGTKIRSRIQMLESRILNDDC